MTTIVKPTVGDTAGTWGTTLNTALDALNGGKQDSPILQPAIGFSVAPNYVSAVAAATPTYQTETFTYVDVSPGGWQTDAAVLNIASVYSGTTTPTIFAALHPTDPVTGYPNTATTLASGSLATTSATGTGIKPVTWAAPLTLSPGRYWLGFLLAGSAVTTAGTLSCISGNGWNPFPQSAGLVPGTSVRALSLTGLSALKNTATLPSAFASIGTNLAPVMNLRRSA